MMRTIRGLEKLPKKVPSADASPSLPTTATRMESAYSRAVDERVSLIRAYVGERENRRHKPGRAFERSFYRFDVLSDYGAFRDMQRHRMLTIEWQRLFASLIREFFHTALFQAAAESLASENASRLASMHAAERNIEDRLEELNMHFRMLRQQSITEELLDITSGFEALSTRRA